MVDPEEYGLVLKALTCGLSNCVAWSSERDETRIRNDPSMLGWSPAAIRREVIRQVKEGARITQVVETWPGYNDLYRFYYKVIIALPEFRHGLFVEMRLVDEDPEFPCVEFVNAHPQVP